MECRTAHNTAFGLKRPAICTLAVYFLHSTRLVSLDSIVDRHWLPAADCCQRYLPCAVLSTRVRRRREFGEVSCTECTDQRNDFELIPMVKMETRHPVEGTFGNEFPSIYKHCGVMAA